MTRIYKLYDPREPDIVRYVGKTKSPINIRYNAHIYNARKNTEYYSCRWIKKLINEGVKPKIEILDVCEDQDWEFWEKFYIMKYKNSKLTNIEDGGKSPTLRKYNRKGTNKNAKPVEMYSLDGDFIKLYSSVAEAARENKLNRHVIAACCTGKQSKAYNYKWKYQSDVTFKKK